MGAETGFGALGLVGRFAPWIARAILKPLGITDQPVVRFSEPYDRADPDTRTWFHVNAYAVRRRWPGRTVKPIPHCRIKLNFKPTDGGESIEVDGMWATNEPPHIASEVDLRVGEPHKPFPLVLRSDEAYPPPGQPSANVQPDITYITGSSFFAHGSTALQLRPGQYDVEAQLYSSEQTLGIVNLKLFNPEQGLYGFELLPEKSERVSTLLQASIAPGSRNQERARVLLELARLRSSGVRLRNDGMRISVEDQVPQWVDEARRWDETVKAEITKLSPAAAEIYETLDWIQSPSFPDTLNEEHSFYLRILSHR